jgi:DNA repair exonuclease SbcCD nuclease subunit
MKIEFIHCADLHLGCNSSRLDERYDDFFNAFDQLIEYTHLHNVHYIIISGDFFHLKVINSKTLQRTMNLLAKAKTYDIKVMVIEGNHDRAFYVDEDSWLAFLNDQEMIILLTSTVQNQIINLQPYQKGTGSIYEDDTIRVIGLGYLGSTTEKYLGTLLELLPAKDKPTILMMHAAVNRLYGQDMGDVKKDSLKALADKVDYIALGHIHNRYDYDGLIFNPGSLENIRIKDGANPDLKGFFHVVIENGVVQATHIPSQKRDVFIESIDATPYLNPNDLIQDILDRSFSFSAQSLVQINIYGKVEFNPLTIDVKRIEEQLKDEYQLLQIEVNNYANILQSMDANQTEIDMSLLVKNQMMETIGFHYPNVKNREEMALQMLALEHDLLEKRDANDIISRLSKGVMADDDQNNSPR